MPVYRVNVVASYPATEPYGPEYPLFEVPHAPHAMKQSDAVVQAIHDWAEEFERREDPPILGVSIAEDPQISPARLTMTVTYEIDAPSEWDARSRRGGRRGRYVSDLLATLTGVEWAVCLWPFSASPGS
jgi:hypothetical protein